jgi:hypothetical protein
VFEGLDRIAEIARTLVGDGFDLTRLCIAQEDLEEQFMKLTKGTK